MKEQITRFMSSVGLALLVSGFLSGCATTREYNSSRPEHGKIEGRITAEDVKISLYILTMPFSAPFVYREITKDYRERHTK